MGHLRESGGGLLALWNGAAWREVRQAHLLGERHPACQHCWKLEDRGLLSFRQSHNHDRPLPAVDEFGHMGSSPEEVHIRLGNECNLKCVMCTPHNSTKWSEDSDIYGQFVDRYFGDEVRLEIFQDSWAQQIFTNAKVVQFAGGEPFAMKQHERIIDLLLKSGRAAEIELIYYTNGTLYRPELLSKLTRFRNVVFNFSIDGYQDSYEHIRFPSKWDKLTTNLDKFLQYPANNFKYRIFTLFFTLTAFDIKFLFQFRNQLQTATPLEIVVQDLREPVFFDARCFSPKIKEQLAGELDSIIHKECRTPYEGRCLMRQASQLNEDGPMSEAEAFHQAGAYLAALDQRRGTDHRKIYQARLQGLLSF
jgi:sulfatase maturation enzyme AslB (radical SAM superfamily)